MRYDKNNMDIVRDSTKETPLHIALKKRHTAIAKILVKAGSKINSKDDKGVTPFMMAAKLPSSDILSSMLDQTEAEIACNETDKLGHGALHFAVCYGTLESMDLLLSKPFLKIENSRPRIFELLLEANREDNLPRAQKLVAAMEERECLKKQMYMCLGRQQMWSVWTPVLQLSTMHWRVHHKHDLFKLFLEKGCEVNAMDRCGKFK